MGTKKPRTPKINTDLNSVKRLSIYAQSQLPTSHGLLNCVVFRESSGVEHVALIKGQVTDKSEVLCRIHSECLTGEVFGSLKCDCKQQLDAALDEIQKYPEGVVLYLRQEGRGIGLGNKIKAYALQEQQGLDTVDANKALGLPVDARDYKLAVAMLEILRIESVRLLTNNPLKVQELEQSGIHTVREHLRTDAISEQALKYVQVKQKRLGHHD